MKLTSQMIKDRAKELGIDETEVTKFGGASRMNVGYTKK